MALVKTEKLECDICGAVRGVLAFSFTVRRKVLVGEAFELKDGEAVSIDQKDLCPACLKRAMKFQARGLSKPDESNAVAPRTGA